MKNVFGSILLAVVLGAGSVLGDDAFDRARPFRKMTVMAGSISNGVCLMTDYRPKSTDVIRARFRLLRLDGQNRTLFCARSSMDDATALAYFASMKTTKHSRFDLGGTQYAGEVDLNTNDVYDVVYDGRIHLSSQGTELEVKGPETVPAWTAPTPLFLFASYTVADTGEIDNVGNFAHLEFYSFEIFSSTDPSSLLHKYVPACDEDGTACVADLVTRRLLYGTGSTPTMGFKLDEADALTGPVLPPGYATAEYLQSHGTEYVDLGVKFNGMWTYTLVFSPDASDLTCGVFGARHTSPAGVEAIAMYSQLHHSLFGIDMHGRLFDSGARVTFSGTRPDTPYRAVISSETCTIEPLDGSSPLVVMPAKTKVELGNTFETAWLFAVHGQDSWHRTPMKFYSLSILSSRKALHRNYLPVRNWQTDAEPEVYESCLGELLPRLGEGRLTVPPPAMRNVCWYDRRLRMSVRRPASSTAAGFTVYLAGNNLLDDVDAWTAWGTSFAFPDAFAAQDTTDVSLGPIPSAYSVACVRFSDGTWSEAIVAPDERAVDGTVLTLR